MYKDKKRALVLLLGPPFGSYLISDDYLCRNYTLATSANKSKKKKKKANNEHKYQSFWKKVNNFAWNLAY